jgi:hypothetical protein
MRRAFRENDIASAVLPEPTDQDLKDLRVPLGHRGCCRRQSEDSRTITQVTVLLKACSGYAASPRAAIGGRMALMAGLPGACDGNRSYRAAVDIVASQNRV